MQAAFCGTSADFTMAQAFINQLFTWQLNIVMTSWCRDLVLMHAAALQVWCQLHLAALRKAAFHSRALALQLSPSYFQSMS